MKKKNLWKLVAALTLAFVCAGSAYTLASVYAEETKSEDLIEENIYIDSIPVGGLTQAQAMEVVEAYVEELEAKPFTLSIEEKSVTTTAKEFGIVWKNTGIVKEAMGIGKAGNIIERYKAKKDLEHEAITLPIELEADKQQVRTFLENQRENLDQDAIDCGLTHENGVFTIVEGQNGIAVDVDRSIDKIAAYIAKEWNKTDEVMLALEAEVVEPQGSRQQLERVKDVIGSFTTDFSSSAAGRAQNVRNGASKINGTVLYPGQQFSVYEAVNPFSAENGYELAGSYENGTTVQTYGGGICQVSSTLYNAVIRAELQVDERFCHSMIVSYVQPSMDAAIAGTYKDLKFTNSYDFPIYLEGYTSGGLITFNIYGEENRSANREVLFESETTSTTEPPTQFVAAEDQAVGYMVRTQSAHIGYTAQLWKIVKENGVEVSRKVINNSTYRPSSKIVAVGVASDNPEASAAVRAAIATQDEATIQAAVAANNQQALEQAKQQEEEEKEKEEASTDDTNENKKPSKKDEEQQETDKPAEE